MARTSIGLRVIAVVALLAMVAGGICLVLQATADPDAPPTSEGRAAPADQPVVEGDPPVGARTVVLPEPSGPGADRRITGRVTDVHGRPVAGATILVGSPALWPGLASHADIRAHWDYILADALGARRMEELRQVNTAGRRPDLHEAPWGFVTSTDSAGAFAVPILVASPVVAAASHDDHGFAAAEVPVADAATPSVTLQLKGVMRFEGKVIDDRGIPVFGASAKIYRKTEGPISVTPSGPDGTFRTPILESGIFGLFVTKTGYESPPTIWTSTDEIRGSIWNEIKLLHLGHEDRVIELVDKDGIRWSRQRLIDLGIPGGEVARLRFWVSPTDNESFVAAALDPVAEEQSYEDEGVLRGKSRVRPGQQEHLGIWHNNYCLGRAAFTRAEQPSQTVAVELPPVPDPAYLRVVLTGRVPAAGVTVVLVDAQTPLLSSWVERASRSGVAQETTLELPRFTGSTIFAVMGRGEGVVCRPRMMRMETPPNSGQVLLIDLALEDASGSMVGSIRDAAGAPVVGAHVTVRDPQDAAVLAPEQAVVQTDSRGAFAFRVLPVGRLRLYANHPRHGMLATEAVIRPEEQKMLSLDLRGMRPVTLRLPNDRAGRQLTFITAAGVLHDDRFFGIHRMGEVFQLHAPAGTFRVDATRPYELQPVASCVCAPGQETYVLQ